MRGTSLVKRLIALTFAFLAYISQILIAVSVELYDTRFLEAIDREGIDNFTFEALSLGDFSIMLIILFIVQTALFILNIKSIIQHRLYIKDTKYFLYFFIIAQTITGFGLMYGMSNYGEGFFELLLVAVIYGFGLLPGVPILDKMLNISSSPRTNKRLLGLLGVLFSFGMSVCVLFSGITEGLTSFFKSPYLSKNDIAIIILASGVLVGLSYASIINLADINLRKYTVGHMFNETQNLERFIVFDNNASRENSNTNATTRKISVREFQPTLKLENKDENNKNKDM